MFFALATRHSEPYSGAFAHRGPLYSPNNTVLTLACTPTPTYTDVARCSPQDIVRDLCNLLPLVDLRFLHPQSLGPSPGQSCFSLVGTRVLSSDAKQESTRTTTEADSARGLLDRFRFGALARKAILIGNSYSGMSWTKDSYLDRKLDFEIHTVELDHGRMKKWVELIPGRPQIVVKSNADKATIKNVFESCHTVPALIYVNGHASLEDSKCVYYPADCSLPGSPWPSSSIPLTEMGEWLTEKEESMELVLVTDFCYCSNFLKLPYEGEKREDGTWDWKETGISSDSDRWDDKRILHFASTTPAMESYDFPSAGGIYTREFYNVAPVDSDTTFGMRLDRIQTMVGKYLKEYASMRNEEPLEQRHQVYSSHKLDFNDTSIFKTMNLYN